MDLIFRILCAFLILHPLVRANIRVEINPDDISGNSTAISYAGEWTSIVNNFEVNLFELNDTKLKSGIRTFHGGPVPDEVCFHDPTPWGDLYASNEWRPITSTLKPKKALIFHHDVTPIALLKQTFTNDLLTSSAEFNVDLSHSFNNTVKSSWSSDHEVDLGIKVGADIDYGIFSINAGLSFSYKGKWGESVEKIETTTMGSSAGVVVKVEPGQTITAELSVTRADILVVMEYEAVLVGQILAKFNRPYKGSRYWAFNVNPVLNAAAMSSTATTKETIKVGMYSGGNVKIYDSNSRRILLDTPVEIKPAGL